MKVVEFRKPDRQPKHIEVPRLEFSAEYPVGAIHAKTAVTDMEETLGTVGFDRRTAPCTFG